MSWVGDHDDLFHVLHAPKHLQDARARPGHLKGRATQHHVAGAPVDVQINLVLGLNLLQILASLAHHPRDLLQVEVDPLLARKVGAVQVGLERIDRIRHARDLHDRRLVHASLPAPHAAPQIHPDVEMPRQLLQDSRAIHDQHGSLRRRQRDLLGDGRAYAVHPLQGHGQSLGRAFEVQLHGLLLRLAVQLSAHAALFLQPAHVLAAAAHELAGLLRWHLHVDALQIDAGHPEALRQLHALDARGELLESAGQHPDSIVARRALISLAVEQLQGLVDHGKALDAFLQVVDLAQQALLIL
mmetsp:Transcript_5662/g.22249  ORF Transcript_5662/g.22249 Transcript_5662/m.22249 type:complete len:299 (-) Transcript_5662:466-1362(-)